MKIIKYSTLAFFGFFWLLGCSKEMSKYLFEHGVLKDDYRYGDLYRMSNLQQFKELTMDCNTLNPKKIPRTYLVLAGDSFTEKGRVEEGQFAAEKFSRFRVDEVSNVLLDGAERNILIIETVERHFRERFSEVWMGLRMGSVSKENTVPLSILEKIWSLHLPYDEELHQSALFAYDWIMKVREWKAQLNYRLFDRVDEHVKLSKDQKHLLYYLPSQPGISSAFDPISDKEIDGLVENVNNTFEFYKNQGFDEVYLAIIPNKTSILGQDLGEYNHLAQRVESNPKLKMPVIGAYEKFIRLGEKAYALGDTHWSCEGQTYWVNQVNELIRF